MKKFSWKKVNSISLLTFALILSLFNCKDKNKRTDTYISPAFAEYISAYTSGVISSGSPIRIIFSKNAIDSAFVGRESTEQLFQFSPSLKGKTTWLDLRTIEFKPDARMNSGQVYEAEFLLSKLFQVTEELKKFNYSFQVIPQNFELSVNNIKPYVKTELKRQKVEGTLTTADYAENESVEKIVVAQQDGKSLKINWQHATQGNQHSFIIEEVSRKEEASEVKISANGKSLGVERTQDDKVEVPALGDFKLMSAKVTQTPNQYVALQFSDPIKEKQQLNGLISIGEDRNLLLDFDIHDNEIWVYPPARQAGTKTIYLETGIRNINDYGMKKPSTIAVVFEQLKPEIRFVGKGSILPSTDGLILPFEAVNLKAVDVSVSKVFENNILQFLQVNSLSGSSEMYRVGRNVLKKTIQLDNTGVTDLGKWNRYTLDLAKLINTEPGAIYQVSMKFKKAYSVYTCEGESETEVTIEGSQEQEEYEGYREYYYEDNDYYYDGDYNWQERDNPCNGSFYSSARKIQKNILASDIGLIAKTGDDGTTTLIAADLKTTQPLSGVSLEFYDFQQQLLGTLSTDSDGKAILTSKISPFAVVAKKDAQRGYMRLIDGESLSLSGFDVSGDNVSKGLKGFLYGERGVWRPGDSLYLSFILEDKNKKLPAAHPVVFELQNPQGVVTSRLVKSSSENGFYRFATATSSDAPTGNWSARIKVGGTEFNQPIKIETVKPNRLKINLDFGQERITSTDLKGNLEVKWLHGAPGKNLKAEFEVSVFKSHTTFPKYDDYVFEEPSYDYNPITKPFFEGYTNADGKATINASLDQANYPGFMTTVFRGKVFEESGNFSIDRFSLPFFPYESYAGLRVPPGEKYSGMLYTDQEQKVEVTFLDIDGKPVSRDGAEINLYRLNRYWWWDNSYDNIANYIVGNNTSLVSSGSVSAGNGKGSWSFKIGASDWGTYYVKVCDPISGHCTGQTIYVDQPGYFGRNSREETKGSATRLTFAADKQTYNVGEKINLTIPGSGEGRALVSIENGSRIISTQWVETKKGENKISLVATPEMTPNIFVNVSLLQPHAQTINDLPIRLYGIIPLGIENPSTHLEPVIEMANELEPGQEVSIKISEKSKRKMTFTVAMVDEGLLDITKFKTPEPWKKFYAREALGVKTWDLYDDVIGAFGSRVERLLAIGGGDEAGAKDDDPRANRFKPVVKFFGPFTLDGGHKELKFTMPQYIGSVKVMAIAGYEGAYGSADKAVPVRKPLMVLATLPRVLGPEEKVRLPITLFINDKKLSNVKIEVKASGPLSLVGETSRSVQVPASGDLTVDFDLAVKSETGIGKVTVTASSGSYKATDEIEIEIRNPNVPATQVTEMYLEAGKTWNGAVLPVGVAGTNSSVLEVSSIPPINLGYRLRYLIEYPHGCIEQTTSAAFPQLYLSVVKELTEQEKVRTKFNVTKAIERLKMFITRDGGFAYWPGNEDSDSWGTTYAGHFLLEAIDKGYFVPDDMLKRWKKYQKNKSAEWRRNDNQYNYSTDLTQAYRLYTLSMAGVPELGAMNRLREMKDVSMQAKWMLAAAYVKAGQPEAAKSLVTNLTTSIKAYQEMSYSYGSDVRDQAIILETLILLNEKTKAFELMKMISSSLSNQSYWMSTQSIAYCLKSVGQFIASEKRGDLKFGYTYNGKQVNAVSQLPLSQIPLEVKGAQKSSVKVANQSSGGLFVRIINTGTPARGEEKAEENNLVLYTTFTDMKGNQIEVSRLEQGTQFLAIVTVKNPGLRGEYQNMALAQVFPSGWEINNLRLTDDENLKSVDRGDYQDIRDDRVYTYFRLGTSGQRTFIVSLTASFAGTFYLPGVSCEAMYDHSISAKEKGEVVEVVKKVNISN